MKKPKEIKLIFLLAFLFLGNSIFSQKDSSARVKQNNYSFKFGANYLLEYVDYSDINYNYHGSHGLVNPTIYINREHNVNRTGIYFGFGETIKRSRIYSTFIGATFSNYKLPFNYEKLKSETPVGPTPTNHYLRIKQIAEGDIYRNIIGLEMNFQFAIKKTKLILSPFNPSVIYSREKYSKREIRSYDVIVAYEYTPPSYYYKYDSVLVLSTVEASDFKMERPYLPGVIVLPFYAGVEQKIPLKKNSFLIGAKASFVILAFRSKSFSYGGHFYVGYEF